MSALLTIFGNAKVVTLDRKGTIAEAVLVGGGRVLGVGGTAQMRELAPLATFTDLRGDVLYPGFIESHAHMIGFGLSRSHAAVFYNLDLAPITSREQMLDLVTDQVRHHSDGDWITGRGFCAERWPDRRLLERTELDRVAPRNPVALNDLGGHTLMTNSAALRLGKINRDTPLPSNGYLHTDSTGEPTGVLNDAAMLPVINAIPTPTEDEMLMAAKTATREMVRLGITEAHHIRNVLPGGYGPEQLRPFVELERRRELPLRVHFMIEAYQNASTVGDYRHIDALTGEGFQTGFGGRVKIGAIKIISDGWLDSRSAAQYEPYWDAPGKTGYLRRTPEDYRELIYRAHAANFQIAVHCDGVRSTDIILDAYEYALARRPVADHRHRLEHASVLTDEQIVRIARLGLIVCTVPSYRNYPWYKDMVRRAYGPDRAKLCLRYKSLQQAGVLVFGGSDCHPCEDEWLSPIGQIYLNSVEGPLESSERFSRRDAIEMFTQRAAFASFDEDMKGTIEPGKYADFTLLSGDPLDVPDKALRDIEVRMTIVDGEIVYVNEAEGVDSASTGRSKPA